MRMLLLPIFYVLFFSLIYEKADVNAATPDDSYNSIIEEFTEKCNYLYYDINKIYNELSEDIYTSKYSLEDQVQKSMKEISNQARKKQDDFEWKLKHLENGNEDFKICLQTNINYIKTKITLQSISSCRPTNDFAARIQELVLIGEYSDQVSELPVRCTKVPTWSKERIIKCFNDAIETTQINISKLKGDIQKEMKILRSKTKKCIVTATNKTKKELDNLKCNEIETTTSKPKTTERFTTVEPTESTTEEIWTTIGGDDCSCSCDSQDKRFKCEIIEYWPI